MSGSSLTAFASHPACGRHDTGWRHPDHQGRLPALVRAVYRDMVALHPCLLEIEAIPAAEEDLLLAHTPSYLNTVRAAAAAAAAAGTQQLIPPGVVVSAASWDAATAAAGVSLAAANAVAAGKAQNAFGATRPSGAGAAAGSAGGFSIFNNLAICARHLVQRHGSDRVLVIEVGGSGPSATPSLLAGDRCIRVLSLREAGPAHSPLPVQLPAGMAGAAFLDILDSALAGATAAFDPEYVVAGIGFDALATDPVGSLALEPVDFYALGQRLMEAGGMAARRVVALLEGGYHAAATGEATVQLLRALCGLKAA